MVIGEMANMFVAASFVVGVRGADAPKAGQTSDAAPAITITYLANEGIAISSGDRVVLIDALFRDGVGGYARVEPATLARLETARSPYDDVRLVLVSHYHKDHFDPESVLRHLTNNPKAILVSSVQVTDVVRTHMTDRDKPHSRIRGFAPAAMKVVRTSASGVDVDVMKLSHGGGRFADVWNLGLIVHLGGRRVLHIGDAHLSEATTRPLEAYARNVDVACIPYWWLLGASGRAFVRDTLTPKHVIAFHIPPAEAQQVTETIHAHMPDVTVFTKPGQAVKH